MAQKPSTPKGTRDFNATQIAKRQYIQNIIKDQFQNFGFQPIETPSFENLSTLIGQYGEEGDKLIFKILNSGDYWSKVKINQEDITSHQLTPKISEKALRYDLTVPFARFVVQHRNDIQFPFKRYQIQPVWRADRPQKGRYREFFQCDADVVGSKSLWQEVEFIMLYDNVFSKLKMEGVTIHINHRMLLYSLCEVIGLKEEFIAFTVILDKLDKIGVDAVKDQLFAKGLSEGNWTILKNLLFEKKSFENQIATLKNILKDSESGTKALGEIEFIFNTIHTLGLATCQLQLNLSLARGLSYYTGAIFEVSAPSEVGIGSIGGGGRYDNLTSQFGLKDVGGVGISFGLDRIYLALESLECFPNEVVENTDVLFLNFGEAEALFGLKAIIKLRENNIKAELYPDVHKIKKQLNYVQKRNIPYVVLVGSDELKKECFLLKNMQTGTQKELDFNELQGALQNNKS